MTKLKPYSKIIVFFLCLSSCIDEFKPDIGVHNKYLVVEGLIKNENKIHQIKLSKTVGIGDNEDIQSPVSDAVVEIFDDLGNRYKLTNGSLGRYYTDSTTFKAKIGRSYKAHLLVENIEYESDIMELLYVPEIKNIYHEYYRMPSFDYDINEGFNIFLDSYDSSGTCFNYRYKISEVWEVMIRWPYPPIEKRNCWFYNIPERILLKNTNSIAENRIVKFPLISVSTNTNRLKIKYCLLVDQFSLNREEFAYWEMLKLLNQEIGSLYDVIPTSIKGNIKCIGNPDELVLGYFSVSAKTSKKYFISAKDHNLAIADPYLSCPETEYMAGLPYYILDIDETYPGSELPFTFTYDIHCVDCTIDGENKKPAYWDDEL